MLFVDFLVFLNHFGIILILILSFFLFKFKEILFSKKALLNADEVFMTSATNFIMPIIKVDSYKISNGKPGPFSQRLRQEFINSI